MEKISKEDKKSILRVIIYIIIGLVLSSLFFYLDYKFNNTFIRIITCIISYLSSLCMFYKLNEKENVFNDLDNGLVIYSLIYIVVTSIVLLFFMQSSLVENPSIIFDCIVWSIYTMPSFILVVTIIMFFLLALEYA